MCNDYILFPEDTDKFTKREDAKHPSKAPCYAKRDPKKLEPFFSKNMMAMTEEMLEDKADIAMELAARDIDIRQLRLAAITVAAFIAREKWEDDVTDRLERKLFEFAIEPLRKAAGIA